MNTKTTDRTIISKQEEEGQIEVIRYIPGERVDGRLRRRMRPLVRWFGTLSTAVLGFAALEPGFFRIPPYAQGWLFLTFILWIFIFCAGMFNL